MGESDSSTAPQVVVFDDHRFVALAVVTLLGEIDVPTAAASSLEELRSLLRAGTPELVLCDLSLADADGFSVISELSRMTRVVVLSAEARPEGVHRALCAGAHGYLSKLVSPHELKTAVRSALDGLPVIDPESLRRLFEHLHTRPTTGDLTAREAEVAELLVAGRSNQEIADTIFVGVETVRTHMKNLYEKLGCTTRSQAVAILKSRSSGGMLLTSDES
jgi:NarL family two-component system response regulator LiaR